MKTAAKPIMKKGMIPAGFADGGKVKPFAGKQTKAEEMAEAKAVKSGKMTAAQYAAKEKAEGDKKPKSALMARGKQLASGKMSAAQYGAKATGMKKGG
jgi:hypothetical protein